MKSMNILLEAYLDRNFGDDLFIALLIEHYKEHAFYLLDNVNRGYVVANHHEGGQLISITENEAHTRLQEFDSYVFVGGDFYHPYSDYDGRIKRAKGIKDHGGSVIILGGSLYREYPEDRLELMNSFFELADLITFRDSTSYFQCTRMFPKARTVLSSDMAFTLDSKYNKQLDDPGEYVNLGISIRRKLDASEEEYQTYCRMVADISALHLKTNGANTVSFLALSTGTFDDRDTADRIKALLSEEMRERINMIDYSRDVFKFIDSVKVCDAIITTRFHSLCIALILGKPFYPINYEAKVENLLKDLGFVGQMVDYGVYVDPESVITSIIGISISATSKRHCCIYFRNSRTVGFDRHFVLLLYNSLTGREKVPIMKNSTL